MTYYAGYGGSGAPSSFHDWLRACLINEPGWSVLYWKAVDSGGRTVSAFRNLDNNFTVLTYYTANGQTNPLGVVTAAEDYDFAAGTATNPTTLGTSVLPLSGDRAFSGPVALGSTTSAFPSYSNSSTQNALGLIVSRDFLAFGYRTTLSLQANYIGFYFGAIEPLAPSLEPTTTPFTYIAGTSVRVARSPLSSTGSASGVNWTMDVLPWHTAADWGADAYAPDTTALPSTRAVLRRTNGATDGLGISRGLLKGFRWGSGGTQGQQMTDDDGAVWRYNDATSATRFGPLTGWFRQA